MVPMFCDGSYLEALSWRLQQHVTPMCAMVKGWTVYLYWWMVINPLIGIHMPIAHYKKNTIMGGMTIPHFDRDTCSCA